MNESRTTREQRLAAALRANLRRRKQQAREGGRAESVDPEDSGNAAGEAPEQGGSAGES